MDSTIKVSIIIPVYNGAEYLRRCFDSCIYQSLPQTEVIAVNDCSPNARDGEIMREYEELYPGKFHALFHSKNKRQGGARNTGLKAANGKYFLCVDQDDFIAIDMCEKMYESIVSASANLCMCGCNYLSAGTVTYQPPLLYEPETLYCQSPAVWKLLVKRSFVLENKAYFPENVVTDDVVSILWFALTNNYCTIPDALYNWVVHNSSESHSQPYRYCQTLPNSFIQLSKYKAYKNLPAEKKAWINISLALHLFYAARISVEKLPGKVQEIARLIVEVMDVFKPTFAHRVFSNTPFGKLYSQTLNYIYGHVNNPNFEADFVLFYNTLVAKLELERIPRELAEKVIDKSGNITVWGAGVRGKRLCSYLAKAKVSFKITDANPDMYGINIGDVTVKPWSELKNKTNLVIVTPKNAFAAVKNTINDDRIEVTDYREYFR